MLLLLLLLFDGVRKGPVKGLFGTNSGGKIELGRGAFSVNEVIEGNTKEGEGEDDDDEEEEGGRAGD